jgi:hypothetical protein
VFAYVASVYFPFFWDKGNIVCINHAELLISTIFRVFGFW